MEFALSQTSFELLEILLPACAGTSLIIANARKIRLLLLQYENHHTDARKRDLTEAVDMARQNK